MKIDKQELLGKDVVDTLILYCLLELGFAVTQDEAGFIHVCGKVFAPGITMKGEKHDFIP